MKAYVGDIGTAIEVNTFIDLTAATTMEFRVRKPDTTEEVWTATIPEALTAVDGILTHLSEAGDFDQPGKYRIQAYIETLTTAHLGETAYFDVYDAFQ